MKIMQFSLYHTYSATASSTSNPLPIPHLTPGLWKVTTKIDADYSYAGTASTNAMLSVSVDDLDALSTSNNIEPGESGVKTSFEFAKLVNIVNGVPVVTITLTPQTGHEISVSASIYICAEKIG